MAQPLVINISSDGRVTSLVVAGEEVERRSDRHQRAWTPRQIVTPDTRIDLATGSPAEWRCLAEAVLPSESILRRLWDEWEHQRKTGKRNPLHMCVAEPDLLDAPPVTWGPAITTVNGKPWLWCETGIYEPGQWFRRGGRPVSRWKLVPWTGPRRLLRMDMRVWGWEYGVLGSLGIFYLDEVLLLQQPDGPECWENGSECAYEVHYPGVSDVDPDSWCAEFLGSKENTRKIPRYCPNEHEEFGCDQDVVDSDDDIDAIAFERGLEASDGLSEATLAALMKTRYRPCRRHADEVSVELAGRRWRWVRNVWLPGDL